MSIKGIKDTPSEFIPVGKGPGVIQTGSSYSQPNSVGARTSPTVENKDAVALGRTFSDVGEVPTEDRGARKAAIQDQVRAGTYSVRSDDLARSLVRDLF